MDWGVAIMNEIFRIGTRGSQLALWQAEFIKRTLEERYPTLNVEIITIRTTGDKILDSSLSSIGNKGIFTREIEQALLNKRIDAAVHSLKDLPTELPAGLMIAAVTKREDVRDAFVPHPRAPRKRFAEIPHGGTIATGSLRRKSQILNWRRDLHIVDLRGNVDTRLRKLAESDWDGIVAAYAGLLRLGFSELATEIFPTQQLLPAVGQGAIAVEIREDDTRTRERIVLLNHEESFLAVMAERAFLRRLEGGCQIPIGAFGEVHDDLFVISGYIGSLDGAVAYRGTKHGTRREAESIAVELAEELLISGAEEILREIRGMPNAHQQSFTS